MDITDILTKWFFEQPNKDKHLTKEQVGNSLLLEYTPRQIIEQIQAKTTLGYNFYLRLNLSSKEFFSPIKFF